MFLHGKPEKKLFDKFKEFLDAMDNEKDFILWQIKNDYKHNTKFLKHYVSKKDWETKYKHVGRSDDMDMFK